MKTEELASLVADLKKLEERLQPASVSINVARGTKTTNSTGNTLTPSTSLLQPTIFGFFGGKGPKFARPDVSGSVCEDCGKDCTNNGGLVSHRDYCPKVKENAQIRVEATERVLNAMRQPSKDSVPKPPPSPRRDSVAYAHESNNSNVDGRGGNIIRKNYALWFKLRMIDLLISLKKSFGRGALEHVSNLAGIHKSNLSKWLKQETSIRLAAAKAAGIKGARYLGRVLFRQPRGKSAMFDAAEEIVMTKFDKARAKRQRVLGKTLRIWMRVAVDKLYPNDPRARAFRASQHWLSRFSARNNLTLRRTTR